MSQPPVQPDLRFRPRCSRLTAAAAQFAARHEEPDPASILTAAATRAEALEVVFKGTRGGLGTQAAPVYAVVITGRFASYRGGPAPRPAQPPMPRSSGSSGLQECSPPA
jgi:hypothetical protein